MTIGAFSVIEDNVIIDDGLRDRQLWGCGDHVGGAGVKIGQHALVAAHSNVARDVEAFTVVGGSPARFLCPTAKIRLKDGTDRPAYPWTSHFQRGYPPEIQQQRNMFPA